MNKLKQFAEGKIFVDEDGDLRRFDKKTDKQEISFDKGKSWELKYQLNLINLKYWKLYEPIKTYKSEDIEFTVKEKSEVKMNYFDRPEYLIKFKNKYYIGRYDQVNQRFITFAEEYNSYDVIIIGKLKDIELTFLQNQEVS